MEIELVVVGAAVADYSSFLPLSISEIIVLCSPLKTVWTHDSAFTAAAVACWNGKKPNNPGKQNKKIEKI